MIWKKNKEKWMQLTGECKYLEKSKDKLTVKNSKIKHNREKLRAIRTQKEKLVKIKRET